MACFNITVALEEGADFVFDSLGLHRQWLE
jgi:hypothetical protein